MIRDSKLGLASRRKSMAARELAQLREFRHACLVHELASFTNRPSPLTMRAIEKMRYLARFSPGEVTLLE